MVERQLPKLNVAGSIPVSRSMTPAAAGSSEAELVGSESRIAPPAVALKQSRLGVGPVFRLGFGGYGS